MKDYRQLNRLMTDMREIVRFSYDKGYEKAKKEYRRSKGHWIRVTGHNRFIEFKCSNCGKLTNASYLWCPNCGADMRQEADNETDN